MTPLTRLLPPAAVATPRSAPGRRAALALLVACLLAPAPARAAALRVIASDASGVTLQLDIDAWGLEAEEGGRSVPVVDGLARTDDPGRPRLPFAATMLAIPPGTRAVARVLTAGDEEIRERTPIAIAARPDFVRDEKLGLTPVLVPQDAIRDGDWPLEQVRIGEPFSMRERRFVALQVFPFRYDEDGARVAVTRSMTVRVDFTGAGRAFSTFALDGAPDPQFDAVFETQVLNWEQGRAWRGARPLARERGFGRTREPLSGTSLTGGPALDAFDESEPEVRVRIDTTGVYGLEYDSLAVYGYPANVPITEVSVHRHEYVENQNPPYVTIDLPIETLDDDGDGVFGPGDRIVVWVWEWAQRSRASYPQRAWGNAEVIYVTRRFGAARIEHRNGWLDRNDLTPLASHPARRRYERNLAMQSLPADTLMDHWSWTNTQLYCAPEAYPFETNDIDPAIASSITVQWVGINSAPHITWARLTNGLNQQVSVIDSASWFGIREETRTGGLAAGALTEGRTNTLRLWGKTIAADDCADNPIVLAGLNWFDVSYWRRFKPIQGYLSCNSATETSDFEIRAGPFRNINLLRAYDVSDSTRPLRLDNVDLSTVGPDVFLRLQDTASPSVRRQYVIFDVPRSPAPGAMRPVTRHRIFDHTAGDYLVVVPEGFRNAVQPLVDLHNAQGLRVVVAPLEGIQDEFNGGRKSAYGIKRFVRYAYNNWNARFVLLVGDGSEDPQRNLTTSSPDIVPSRQMFGPVPVPFAGTDYLPELVPADFWYVWCLNCSTATDSLKPSLFVGRLPVSTLTQVNAVVSKIVNYENLSGDQSWRRRMVLTSDDAFSGETTFGGPGGTNDYCRRSAEQVFARINVVVDSLVRKRAGLAESEVDLFNLSYYLPNRPGEYTTSGGPDTCRNSQLTFQTRARATATPELFSRLNAGCFWWNYQGHANQYVMSHESFYVNQFPTDDKSRFTNDGRPFLFTAFSCHPNSFGQLRGGNDPTFGPAFGEELVTLPNRGAIASWASVGFEQLPGDHTRHLNVYLGHAMFTNPPRDEYLGDRGSRQVLGEVLLAAEIANYIGRSNSLFERDVSVTYCLLGDPATRLSIGAPQAVVTANGQPVTNGEFIRLTTPGTALTMDATLVSNVRLDSVRFDRIDQNGTTPIWRSSDASVPTGLTVTPTFPDTARGTSQSGGRRFRLIYDDNLRADLRGYVYRTWDRYGLETRFEAVFGIETFLQQEGLAISDGAIVPPAANLSLRLLSPSPVVPQTDLVLKINGQTQTFVAAPDRGDVSGREWILSWSHADYPAGDYTVSLTVSGGITVERRFRVEDIRSAVRLDHAMAFPNPFDEDYLRALNPGRDVATVFSFDLVSATPADVTLRIYTQSGRLIYQRTERRLDPRSQQIPWNGLDAEGSPLANGIYFYKLLASNGVGTAVHEGRLVKLRKPRRSAPVDEGNN